MGAVVGILVLSFVSNMLLLFRHHKLITAAKKDSLMFRRLKWQLQGLLDTWATDDYCMTCKQWNGKHSYTCPQMQVQRALNNADRMAR